ncbi:MAG: calcium-binding protein, partial [Limnospira sp.]
MAIFRVTQTTDNGLGDTIGTLSWAILQANTDAGGADDTIVLEENITVTGVMKRLINSNITLTGDDPDTVDVETATISGGNQFRPLFVKSGTVNLNNLTLTQGKAQGGSSNAGGGGAGMGGALFVYSGTVTVEDVTFTDNTAQGGNGGATDLEWGSRGGGGMFGNAGHEGGGGLFGDSVDRNGGYGGTGDYGGAGGTKGVNSGFGGGGVAEEYFYTQTFGGNGGFGGGGGFGDYGGNGGFGGGGGGAG